MLKTNIMLRKVREKIPQKYLLINVLSKRIHQLQRGKESLVANAENLSYLDIGLTEVLENKLRVKETKKSKK